MPFRPNGSASRRGFTSSHSDLLLLCAGCQGRKRSSCSGWKDNTAGRRQMSRDPGSPTAEPSPESGHRPFLKFQPHGFAPRGRLEDRHATYNSQTSSPDQYMPAEHGTYVYSVFYLALISVSKHQLLQYQLGARIRRRRGNHRSQPSIRGLVWPRSDLSLHNSILSNPAPGGVALGGQIGQADTEATAQSLRMEQCVPGIIGFSVDLLQLLGWWRR